MLPDVESGVIKLIGATTHNPFFFVNSPLVSRSQIFELRPLAEEDLFALCDEYGLMVWNEFWISTQDYNMEPADAALFLDNAFPHWIVSFGRPPALAHALRRFTRPHLEAGKTVSWNYQLEKTLDICGNQTQRPELVWHTFGPDRQFDPASEAVYILKRVKNSVAAPRVSE